MNELTGAVALAQLRKLDGMLNILREKKLLIKNELVAKTDVRFRQINDQDGECATILTLIFDTSERAENVATELGVKTLSYSGWHVYNNMAQIVGHKTPTDDWSEPTRYAAPGSLPETDDILSRSINISIGVVDGGLGAGYGINILSSNEEIRAVIKRILNACNN